jgi:hypothetical protein
MKRGKSKIGRGKVPTADGRRSENDFGSEILNGRLWLFICGCLCRAAGVAGNEKGKVKN